MAAPEPVDHSTFTSVVYRQVDAAALAASQALPSRTKRIRTLSGQVPLAPQMVASVRVRAASTGEPWSRR
ncbi:protein of unknown function [Modestobacter italicus]|uniref:Uncharacterized protein n=1 Tax=Modestobacter italicus (strain DSM 44449 / CECT 9708 / BC 501) TaxID=2732864 RepID=I4F028_MODI5|nr:protein of unknown function [Modestobacter marinus]